MIYLNKERAEQVAAELNSDPKYKGLPAHVILTTEGWTITGAHEQIITEFADGSRNSLISALDAVANCPHCGAPVAEEGCSNGLCEAVN